MWRRAVDRDRIRSAWQGRISACQLGKPAELLSMTGGRDALLAYLEQAQALPLRDYVPLIENTAVDTPVWWPQDATPTAMGRPKAGCGGCKGGRSRRARRLRGRGGWL